MRFETRAGLQLIAVLSVAALAFSAGSDTGPDTRKIKIALERMNQGAWSTVDPGLVLEHGDRVRFRFESNFRGYLYVVNLGSSGSYSTLFPSEKTGRQNAIRAGEMRQVPSGDLDFRITGPAGQETVYWILSPVELPGYAALPPKTTRPSTSTLVPRCDDATLRARGDCVDATAGARDLDPGGQLPIPLKPDAAPSSLTFLREGKELVVAAPGSASAPMVYEFRIAHK